MRRDSRNSPNRIVRPRSYLCLQPGIQAKPSPPACARSCRDCARSDGFLMASRTHDLSDLFSDRCPFACHSTRVRPPTPPIAIQLCRNTGRHLGGWVKFHGPAPPPRAHPSSGTNSLLRGGTGSQSGSAAPPIRKFCGEQNWIYQSPTDSARRSCAAAVV